MVPVSLFFLYCFYKAAATSSATSSPNFPFNNNASTTTTSTIPTTAGFTSFTATTSVSCASLTTCDACTQASCKWCTDTPKCTDSLDFGCTDGAYSCPAEPADYSVFLTVLTVACLTSIVSVVLWCRCYCRRMNEEDRQSERERLWLASPPPPPRTLVIRDGLGTLPYKAIGNPNDNANPNENAGGKCSIVVSPEEAQELLLCSICSENTKSVSLGCGHLLCDVCAVKITNCPFCKAPITSIHRIYF